MVFPDQVKRLNDLDRNSEQFLKHERDLLSLVGDFLDVSEEEFDRNILERSGLQQGGWRRVL